MFWKSPLSLLLWEDPSYPHSRLCTPLEPEIGDFPSIWLSDVDVQLPTVLTVPPAGGLRHTVTRFIAPLKKTWKPSVTGQILLVVEVDVIPGRSPEERSAWGAGLGPIGAILECRFRTNDAVRTWMWCVLWCGLALWMSRLLVLKDLTNTKVDDTLLYVTASNIVTFVIITELFLKQKKVPVT